LCIFGKGGDLLIGEVIGDDGAFDAAFRCGRYFLMDVSYLFFFYFLA
jgi:hypothetical protein